MTAPAPDPFPEPLPGATPNARAAASVGRGRRWPLVLGALALAGLVLGIVVIAQLYWTELHRGVEQMQASVGRAQQEQQRLMARLRAAEARRQGDESRAPGAVPDPGPSAPAPMASMTRQALRDRLPRPERDALRLRLEALGREAARLPGARSAAGPIAGSIAGAEVKQLLRGQLRTAGAAAAAGDVPLLASSLFAAERLCGPPYRTLDGGARRLRSELIGLRRRLLRSAGPAEPPSATAQPLVPGSRPVAPAPHPRIER